MKYSKYIESRIIKVFHGGGLYYKGEYGEEGLRYIDEINKKFSLKRSIDFTFYYPRKFQHYLLIKNKLINCIGDSLLDVGSRNDSSLKILGKKATLIDKNNSTLESWYWEKEKIPFSNNSFNTIICLDTLEHINDIHGSLENLMAVSSNRVIISLPNCWKKMTKNMISNMKGSLASYGLPPEKPMDRHKWFFNTEDSLNFIAYNAYKNNFRIENIIYHAPKTRFWHKLLFPVIINLLPDFIFKNFFVETIFFVLKKV